MKKHPFLLVEVLIAMFLLTLCCIPLISNFYSSFKKQRQELLDVELERHADRLFIQVYNAIGHAPTWSFFSTKHATKHPLDPFEITLEGTPPVTYYCHYHLYYHSQAKSTDKNLKLWCCLCIGETSSTCKGSYVTNHKHPYTYNIFIKNEMPL